MVSPVNVEDSDGLVIRRGRGNFVKISLDEMLSTFLAQISQKTIAIVDVFYLTRLGTCYQVASAKFKSAVGVHAEESALQYLENLFNARNNTPTRAGIELFDDVEDTPPRDSLSIRMYVSRSLCDSCIRSIADFAKQNQALFGLTGIFEVLFPCPNDPGVFVNPMGIGSPVEFGIIDAPELSLLLTDISDKPRFRDVMLIYSVRAALVGATFWRADHVRRKIMKHCERFIFEEGYEGESSPGLISELDSQASNSTKMDENVFLRASGFGGMLDGVADGMNLGIDDPFAFFFEPKTHYLSRDEEGRVCVVCLWNCYNLYDVWEVVDKCSPSLQVSYWKAPVQGAEERRASGQWRICDKSFHRTYIVKFTTRYLENTRI